MAKASLALASEAVHLEEWAGKLLVASLATLLEQVVRIQLRREAFSATRLGHGTTREGAPKVGRIWTVGPSESRIGGGRICGLLFCYVMCACIFLVGHRDLLGASDEELGRSLADHHARDLIADLLRGVCGWHVQACDGDRKLRVVSPAVVS